LEDPRRMRMCRREAHISELAYLNGRFCPIAEACVSIEDRGFQFGDGVYEVVVVRGGQMFLPEQHMRRLRRSAAAIGLQYDFDNQPLEPVMLEGLTRSGITDAMIYVQITRGAAPRSHSFAEGMTPTVVMTFKPIPAVPEEHRRRGVDLMTTSDNRWARCFIKAITLLPNVLAKNEANRRGFYDAVFVTNGGEVRESTSANIFLVSNGTLKTPLRDESVLHGITQDFILQCATAIALPFEECRVHVDELQRADEVFLSSTTIEILPVTSINGAPISDGAPGPITQKVLSEFQSRSRTSAMRAGC